MESGQGGVALLEKVSLGRGGGFDAQAMPSLAYSLLLLPMDEDVELLPPLELCLSALCHAFRHDNGPNL